MVLGWRFPFLDFLLEEKAHRTNVSFKLWGDIMMQKMINRNENRESKKRREERSYIIFILGQK